MTAHRISRGVVTFLFNEAALKEAYWALHCQLNRQNVTAAIYCADSVSLKNGNCERPSQAAAGVWAYTSKDNRGLYEKCFLQLRGVERERERERDHVLDFYGA